MEESDVVGVWLPSTTCVTVSRPVCLSASTDVHPDNNSDCLHVSQRFRLSGDALHAQGLRHHLPPGAERPEEKEKLQGMTVAWLVLSACFLWLTGFLLGKSLSDFPLLPVVIVAGCRLLELSFQIFLSCLIVAFWLPCRLLSRLHSCPKNQMRNRTER